MKFKNLILILLAIIVLPSFASAALLGVNKVAIQFDDVLRNGYAQDSVVISSGSPQDISVFYEIRGDIADWVRFEPEGQPVILNEDNPQEIIIIVEPPEDTRVGSYTGKLLLSTGPLGAAEGNVGSSVVVAFEVSINIGISDTQIISCAAGGYDISDAEIDRGLPFVASFSNNGNVRVKPEYVFEVYNQDQTKVVAEWEYEHDSEVLPTTKSRIEAQLDNDLEPGQYWAYVSSPACSDARSFITFTVLEKGGISDVGELVRIENEVWGKTSEVIPIKAYFKNRGSRFVSAQFKGVISKEGKIYELVESEVLDVAPDELTTFDVFFQPEEPGQYKITGRVTYNNKLTFEKGNIVNINPSGVAPITNNDERLSLLLVIIVIIVGFMIFLILRKKKRRRRF